MPIANSTAGPRPLLETPDTPPRATGLPPDGPQKTPGGPGSRQPGHGSKTEATRERAIVAILGERTIGAAAKRAGVGARTLRRWMTEDEAFQAALTQARRLAFEAGMGRVQALMTRAVETLDELLGAEDYPTVRLGAARTVAELAVHHYDAETILRRLDALESDRRQPSLNGRR